MRSRAVVLAAAALICGSEGAVITIDERATYQTFEGFGGAGTIRMGASGEWDQAGIDLVVNDLGIAIVRFMAAGSDIEGINDNADPENLDMSRIGRGGVVGLAPYMKALRQAGLQKIFLTVMSPPGWMKTNGSDLNGGSLKPDMYAEFAEHVLAWVRAFEREGVPLYAVSLANEPRFAQYWPSIIMTPSEMREAIKAVGARFAREGVTVKIIWAEDVTSSLMDNRAYAGMACADSAARAYGGIFGVHYGTDTLTWLRTCQAVQQCGKPFWGTEMETGRDETWPSAMAVAEGIHRSLKFGQVSAHVLWMLGYWGSDPVKLDESLVNNGQTGACYYAIKCFSRYIRPGAVQIGSSASDAGLLVVAFRHAADRTLAVVVVNNGPATSVTLAGTELPAQFSVYRTASGVNCASLGTVSSSAAIQVPGSSITTLYGSGYDPNTGIAPAPGRGVRSRAVAGLQGVLRSYRVDGRRCMVALERCAPGVTVLAGGNGATCRIHVPTMRP